MQKTQCKKHNAKNEKRDAVMMKNTPSSKQQPHQHDEASRSEKEWISPPFKVQQKVAILIDGNNIERSVHHLMADGTAMLNFDTVVPRLLSGRSLNRLIYFREGKNISSKLSDRLHNLFYGQVQPCHKSADIPLSIKAMQLASKVDTIIIMSGDADYIELLTHLQSEGVRVEIAAVEESTAMLMIEHANYFHPLKSDDFFTYTTKAPSKSSKAIHKSSASACASPAPADNAPTAHQGEHASAPARKRHYRKKSSSKKNVKPTTMVASSASQNHKKKPTHNPSS